MFITDHELQALRHTLELQPGVDEELHRRCQHLVHTGAYDEAVRSAFILLEERLRTAVSGEGQTGVTLANQAFASNGRLAKLLGNTQSEREGLRELYSGAFKLFRNPTAHGVVGYNAADCRDILALVQLLLRILVRSGELVPAVEFPPNLEEALTAAEAALGPGATARLRSFLMRAERSGLTIAKHKQWIGFRTYALRQETEWPAPKRYVIPVFYFVNIPGEYCLHFATAGPYMTVVGFDVKALQQKLAALSLQPYGKNQEMRVDLRSHNDAAYFDSLWLVVQETIANLHASLALEGVLP